VGPFAFNGRYVQKEHPFELSALGEGSIPILPDVENLCIGERASNVNRPETPLRNN